MAETIRACQSGVRQPGEDPFSNADNPLFKMAEDPKAAPGGKAPKKPAGLENFSHQEILEMYQQIKQGKMPEALAQTQVQQHTDADGNPIIDEEGGAMIQPKPGFVVKTKDLKSGTKVFVNITHHEIVEGLQERRITPEEAAKLDASEAGVRIPLSLGDVREDSDKNGNPVQVYDFIFNTDTVKTAQKEAAFR